MEFTNNPKLDRPKKRSKASWVKFAVVTLLYLLFLLWIRSWLGLIVLPFIFDAYITKFLPWGFWKRSKNAHFMKAASHRWSLRRAAR